MSNGEARSKMTIAFDTLKFNIAHASEVIAGICKNLRENHELSNDQIGTMLDVIVSIAQMARNDTRVITRIGEADQNIK